MAYLVARLRRVWPDVVLHFRGDCGFGVPAMYEVYERLRLLYTFGLSTNAVLQQETEGLLAEAVSAYEQERQAARQPEPPRPPVPSRLFTGFWYQAGTWPQARWVVAEAEGNVRAPTDASWFNTESHIVAASVLRLPDGLAGAVGRSGKVPPTVRSLAHFQSRTSGISSPYFRVYCLCSMSLSRTACLT